MQTRIVTRPAIAAMALVIAWATTPRATVAQQCRRTCETGETRDVRGCCVPAAKPARPAAKPEARPERTPRRERRSREAPEAEAPPARPSEPPASKPSEPPPASKPDESQRARRQRDLEPAPARPAPGEPSRPVPAVSPDEQSPGARTTPPTPALEPPGATQRPRSAQPPGATAPGNLRAEPPATTRTEPMTPSRPDTDRPADTRPGMLAPPRVDLTPSEPMASQEPGRRWRVWMPWAVVGAGAVAAGVGGLLYTTASSEYERFDREFDERCMNGCNDAEVTDLADQLDRARTLETTSRTSMIAGGVIVAAGVALVFLNHSTEPTSERATARTFVVPSLGPGAAGILAGISF